MRFQLIACEVLLRELCDAVAHSPHTIDVAFVTKGLHDRGSKPMREELQRMVDEAEGRGYSAVLLGYALCGNGLQGLVARSAPLVIPRAHDCIALLFGSRRRYQEFFENNPGVYFRSTGWLERGRDLEQLAQRKLGIGYTLAELIDRYGEENGHYLFDELYRYEKSYTRLTYIRTGLEADAHFEEEAQEEARQRNWRFDTVEGNLSLFRQLAAGDWDPEDFLVVPPGGRIAASYDEGVIYAEQNYA
jgi:hypothetical protein